MPETGETGPPCPVCGYPVSGPDCRWCGADPETLRKIALTPSRASGAERLGLPDLPDSVREARHRSEAIWSMLSPEFKDGTLGQYRAVRLRAARFSAAVIVPVMLVGFSGGFWAWLAAAPWLSGRLGIASVWPGAVLFMIPFGLGFGTLVERLVVRAGPVRAERRFLESHALVALALMELGREPWYLRSNVLSPVAFAAAAAVNCVVLGLL